MLAQFDAAQLDAAQLDAFVGLPYRPGGRTRAGLDCWGLVVLAARDLFGLDLPAYDETVWRTKSDTAAVGAVAAAEAAAWQAIAPGDERPGDVLLIRQRGAPIHVAIVVAPGAMLHIEDGIDSAIEPYRCLKWERRIVKIGRWAPRERRSPDAGREHADAGPDRG